MTEKNYFSDNYTVQTTEKRGKQASRCQSHFIYVQSLLQQIWWLRISFALANLTREREREREKEKKRDRETERQRDRETDNTEGEQT